MPYVNEVTLIEHNLLIEIVFVKEVKIFPKRYCESLRVNRRQSYKLSELEDDPIRSSGNRTQVALMWFDLGWGQNFLSNLQL